MRWQRDRNILGGILSDMTKHISIRTRAATLLAAFSILLAGCFITPGKFTSQLVLNDNESFAFTYEGEIFFLGLSSLAQMPRRLGTSVDRYLRARQRPRR